VFMKCLSIVDGTVTEYRTLDVHSETPER